MCACEYLLFSYALFGCLQPDSFALFAFFPDHGGVYEQTCILTREGKKKDLKLHREGTQEPDVLYTSQRCL